MKYGLFGKIVAAQGKRDELLGILVQASKLLQENQDCIHYVVGKSQNENEVWVSEVWTSKESHDASLEPDKIRSLIMTARPLIAEMPQGTEFEVIDGKGL